MRKMGLLRLQLVAAVLGLLPSIVFAQSGVRDVPGGTVLVSKDLGGERWAIHEDPEGGAATGNVFEAGGGEPTFVSCEVVQRRAESTRYRCHGAPSCADWTHVATVDLPRSFFEPPEECEEVSAAISSSRSSPDSLDVPARARHSRTGRRTLVSKTIGGERWAITRDRQLGTVTGNVYREDGSDPGFVWCEEVASSPSEIRLSCRGAARCTCAPCDDADWQPLGEVAIPRDFFADDCDSTPLEPLGAGASGELSAAAIFSGADLRYVALSGRDAVVVTSEAREPRVLVLERNGTRFDLVAPLTLPEPESPRFAQPVAIHGDTIVVADVGVVRVFERTGDAWTATATLTPSRGSEARGFPGPVATDGDTIVVGAESEPPAGAAYVYERLHGSWTETAWLPAPRLVSAEFAGPVDVDGDTIVVGAWGASDLPGGGSAWVYRHHGGTWVLDATLQASDGHGGNGFGEAVAIEGERIVVGAVPPRFRVPHGAPGAVYVFEKESSGWSETGKLTTCSKPGGRFGIEVALAGDRILVGVAGFQDWASPGTAHLFHRRGNRWVEAARLPLYEISPDTRSLPRVAMTADAAVVGADRRPFFVYELGADLLPEPDTCDSVPPDVPPVVWPTAEWRVEDPAEHGMEAGILEEARDYAFRPNKHTQSVIVARQGVIVAEWYASDRGPDSFATSWSTAKSVAGALVGIAIDQGHIPSVDVSLSEYFDEWVGTDREAIRLRHVLSMTSGLDWEEDTSLVQPVLSDIAHLASVERDHLGYVLSRPVAEPPGRVFNYSSGDTMLLSGVLEAATGMSAGEYAERALFGPLGMSPVQWWRDLFDRTLTWCCIDAPAREFAKFGLLYARGGQWGDRQLVPREWVRRSMSPNPVYAGYGYQWWLDRRFDGLLPADLAVASGFDGQRIYVMPGLDLVVVRHARYEKELGDTIADPTLYARLPPANLQPGRGTRPPEDGWDDGEFLEPIIASIHERDR